MPFFLKIITAKASINNENDNAINTDDPLTLRTEKDKSARAAAALITSVDKPPAIKESGKVIKENNFANDNKPDNAPSTIAQEARNTSNTFANMLIKDNCLKYITSKGRVKIEAEAVTAAEAKTELKTFFKKGFKLGFCFSRRNSFRLNLHSAFARYIL